MSDITERALRARIRETREQITAYQDFLQHDLDWLAEIVAKYETKVDE